ncbi:hypothetical protein [Bacillus nitroreducens]
MNQPIHDAKPKEVAHEREKPKKSIHQILKQLQSQGVNATLSKRRSELLLGS